MRTRLAIVFLLALTVAACATGGSGEGQPRRNRNLLTLEELVPVEALSAWEAIQRLRPMWMRPGGIRNSSNPRGHYPTVFVDGAPFGVLESLRNFRVTNIQEIRYVGPTDATIRYGGEYQGGIILIVTRGTE